MNSPQKTDQHLGNKIRSRRKKLGLTMHQLAEMVGVSYLTIYRVETEKVSPSVTLLSEIAHCLGQPITSFFRKEPGSLTFIKKEDQPVAEADKLEIRLLAPKGLMSDTLSVSLGKAKKGEFVSPHRTEGFELAYIIRGRCIFAYGQAQYEMKEGDLVYFDGRELHSVVAQEPLEFLAIYLREEE